MNFFNFLGLCLLCASISPIESQTTPPPSYAVIDLGQCSDPFVHGISNSGNVSWITDSQFCRWKPGDTSYESVSIPEGGYDTYVIGGINNNGDVVGAYEESPAALDAYGYDNVEIPLYWPGNSGALGNISYTQYGSPFAISLGYGEVDAINDDGSMYGCSELSTTDYDGVRWLSHGSTPTSLTLFGGVDRMVVWAKNGHTLGESRADGDSGDFDWYLDGSLVSYSPASINSEGDGLEMDYDFDVCAIHYGAGSEVVVTGASYVWDMNSAQLPEHEADGSVTMVSAPQVVGIDDVGNYAVFQQDPNTGDFKITEINNAVPSSCGFSDIELDEINDSGNISAQGTGAGGEHVLLLIPFKLMNLADPYQGSSVIGTPSHNDQDTPIDLSSTTNSTDINAVAWIAAGDSSTSGAPRMPKLQATVAAPNGTMVWWKLSVIFHDRCGNPYRDFDTGASLTGPQTTQLTNVNESGSTPGTGYSDDIDIPMPSGSADSGVVGGWVPIAAGTPWNIYADQDWENAVARGFFGGDAELSFKVTTSDGTATILPEQDFYFRIAGENPPADQSTGATAGAGACLTYITTTYGGPTPDWSGVTYTPGATTAPTVPDYWFAYAISKEETDGNGGRTWYNNFLDNGGAYNTRVPGNEGHPNWQNDGTTAAPVNGTGGYGLFQLTYEGANGTEAAEANFIMPRDWIWNWKSNVQQFLPIIQEKLLATQTHLNYLRGKYPPPSFVDPTSQTTTASATTFNYWESSAITHYNSGSGWHLTPGSGGASGTWNYTPNPQNYLYQVAHKGIENHL